MSDMGRARRKAASTARKRQTLKQPPLATGTSPPQAPPAGRVMLPNFDYMSAAQDIIAQSDEAELATLVNAIRERQRDLGLSEGKLGVGGVRGGNRSASNVLERRPHQGGELFLETRDYIRKKDGARTSRGPYWYFRYSTNGENKVVYLGKTDDPEAKLQEKLAALSEEKPA